MDVDVMIIGSGIAGITAAKKLRAKGRSVVMIESYKWGGVVPNHGSSAKKYLLAAVEAQQAIADHVGIGFKETPAIEWDQLMAFKNKSLAESPAIIKESLQQIGVILVEGDATFIDEQTICVNGTAYHGETIIIATGARPRQLPITGKEYLHYSTQFLDAASLPDSITIIGAGIIAFAIMTIASAAGKKVHVLQHNDRALRVFDPEMVDQLITTLEQRGVTFHFNQTVTAVDKTSDDQYQVKTKEGFLLKTDAVYCVAGRVPNAAYMAAEKADINFTDKGIIVDEWLRTTNPHVFAIGDCNDSTAPKLASYAAHQADYVADVILGNTQQPITYPITAMSVFSQPKLAQTGILVNDARKEPDIYTVETIDMTHWLSYHRHNETNACGKLVIRRSDQRIVGITSLSNEADLLINYFTLLLKMKCTKQDITDMIFAYPTLASDLPKFF